MANLTTITQQCSDQQLDIKIPIKSDFKEKYEESLYPESGSTSSGPISTEILSNNLDQDQLITIDGLLFDNKSIRNGFIRKVYSLLMSQLIVTVAIISFFMYNEPTKQYVQKNRWIFWGSFVILFVFLILMTCFTTARRKAPLNYICFFSFTLAESLFLGCVVTFYAPKTIFIAAGLTVVVCFALTIFSFQTKYDFTKINAMLFISLILLFFFGIAVLIFQSYIMHLIYSFLGVLLFSLYLIHDTQLMIGGKHKYSISPEEYIFGALNLYIDVVTMFLHLLSIRLN